MTTLATALRRCIEPEIWRPRRYAAFGQMRPGIALPDLSGVGWWAFGSWGALLGSGLGGTKGALVFIKTPLRVHTASKFTTVASLVNVPNCTII